MKLDFLGAYDFFAGVPDSQLKQLCGLLMDRYGISPRHIVAANEGNAVALAAGHYLATGRVPVVYLQNSGVGNIVNPVLSLLSDRVYGIPCIFFIGWRGEPGVRDEPQHMFQGEVTLNLLADIGIEAFVVGRETTKEEIEGQMRRFAPLLADGRSVAFVVRKDALDYEARWSCGNAFTMKREEIVRAVVEAAEEGVIVSTTGKTSRELFEIREKRGEGHGRDFLTVGSMGHSSSIALGIALAKPRMRVWCLDGDGAALMHMGAMAVIGANSPANLVHVVINNASHESVGGIPTVAGKINLLKVADGCGYPSRFSASSREELDDALSEARNARELCFIEARAAIGARPDLGRPTTTPQENRKKFMEYLSGKD
ncbi:phosphonopyruvate decarboxylase [Synergistes jonesii]|uniref:Phosphoenolpyruvate decarboxylase n=1 Tax=Synergistes jonesii TaxID=2754 RepID=A0A073J763_9BACT|nr:phosphonopyruvate decarboxylase [Synergistes jonesii]KEJ93542.1 phosphoenolpyruvate decarboxylase [Synergistes jonesii]OFB61400.1 phosphoenolpyruvate decarboxylase [Synergistes jonesii]OFB65322.1 phosphoenolpyruvate decarboxylase [Synergistes jonesii]OFB68672.1 phosphoenolpyruvate decarboxylase [Synergistes jonesii]OFB69338.1 phosphoenolpyruvate decarboxylase [Synergistes jonesii]